MRASGQRGQTVEVRDSLVHSSTSLATKQRPQWAWHVNLCRPWMSWAWLTKLLIPRNCYALSSLILVEGNGKKYYPSSRDDSIQIVTGGFNMLEKRPYNQGRVLMTTTTLQYFSCNSLINCWNWKTDAVQNLWWSSSQGEGTEKLLQDFCLCPPLCVY